MRNANGSGHVSDRTARTTRRAAHASSPDGGGSRGRRRGPLHFLPFLAAALAVVAVVAFVVVPRLFGSGSDSGTSVAAGQTVTVYIPEGSGGTDIAEILLDAGVITDEQEFYQAVKELGADSDMKSGTYDLVTSSDPSDVVNQLVEGPNSEEGTLTVAEGLTVSQTADAVEESLGIDSDDFLEQAKASNYVDDYPFLEGVSDDSLEGFLYAKTYDFGGDEDVTADTVIRAMLDQYQAEVASLDFATAESNIKSTYGLDVTDYDILKIASIVEKESITDDDRAKVASVFYNRLQQGMALQSDATMTYVTGGEVTAEDLQTESPYNTYLNKGLTPTPICNPSLKSIEAALSPADTDYLYFLIIENGDYSNHTFSETYEEHEEAIAQAQEDQSSSTSE